MRDIKFRAWCEHQKRMFSKVMIGNLLDPDSDDYTAHCIYRDGNWYHVDHHDTDVFFMQYTGLKDKNGREIYEGDIVRFRSQKHKKYITGVVEYTCAEFRISHDYGNPLMSGDVYDEEVMGNIHQNPELLP